MVIDGRFEVVEYLGCGGMGSVYRAKHQQLNRDVAIKVLHSSYSADLAAVQRFQREAHIVSTLNHPNVLKIYAFGAFEQFVYLAMEFVDGASLGRLIESGPLPLNEAVPVFLKICDAMAIAHEQDVLHRDLKPDNVMIGQKPERYAYVKVVDFGLAKMADAQYGRRLTKTGEVVGDPRYMSPEQCRGERLDPRSDIYSFGCLMYEVLTGEIPFSADSPVAIMHKHISEPPASFPDHLQLPQAIETIVFNCIEKSPKNRYGSFQELSEDLTKAADADVQVAPRNPKSQRRHTHSPKAVIVWSLAVLCVAGLVSLMVRSPDCKLIPEWIRYSLMSSTKLEQIVNGAALAKGYADQGIFKESIQIYTQAGELAMAEKNYRWIARIYCELGPLYRAEKDDEQASQTYERCLWAAQCEVAQQSADDEVFSLACRSLRGLVETSPSSALTIGQQLSATYLSRKMADKARAVIDIVKLPPTVRAY